MSLAYLSPKDLDSMIESGVATPIWQPGPYDEGERERREREVDGLELALSKLTAKQRYVISARWGLNGQVPMTLQEIADAMKVSHQAVDRLERRATARLERL